MSLHVLIWSDFDRPFVRFPAFDSKAADLQIVLFCGRACHYGEDTVEFIFTEAISDHDLTKPKSLSMDRLNSRVKLLDLPFKHRGATFCHGAPLYYSNVAGGTFWKSDYLQNNFEIRILPETRHRHDAFQTNYELAALNFRPDTRRCHVWCETSSQPTYSRSVVQRMLLLLLLLL